jgi:hypothetical protein
VIGREQPRRGTRGSAEHGGDELVAIDRQRDRAPDAAIGEPAIAEVEGEVVDARTGTLADRELAPLPEPVQHLGFEGILNESEGPSPELEHPDDLVGHDPDGERAEARGPPG